MTCTKCCPSRFQHRSERGSEGSPPWVATDKDGYWLGEGGLIFFSGLATSKLSHYSNNTSSLCSWKQENHTCTTIKQKHSNKKQHKNGNRMFYEKKGLSRKRRRIIKVMKIKARQKILQTSWNCPKAVLPSDFQKGYYHQKHKYFIL